MSNSHERHARQILRFVNAGHPHATEISGEDVDYARELAGPQFEPEDRNFHEDPYPLEWITSTRSLKAFLKRWRKLYRPESAEESPVTTQTTQTIQTQPASVPHPEPTNPPGFALQDPVFAALLGALPRIAPASVPTGTDNLAPAGTENSAPATQSLSVLENRPVTESMHPIPPPSVLDTSEGQNPTGPSTVQRTNLLGINHRPLVGLLQFGTRARRATLTKSETPVQTTVPILQPVTPVNKIGIYPKSPTPISASSSSLFVDGRSPSIEQGHNSTTQNSDSLEATAAELLNKLNQTSNSDRMMALPLPDPSRQLTAMETANMIASAFDRIRQETRMYTSAIVADAFENYLPSAQGSSLKAQDVGYFHPDAKDTAGAGLTADGKVNKYTDVFAFTERLKHLVRARGDSGERQVREVWTQCLQGKALIWHSHVLTETDRELLETAPVNAICNKLIDKFRKDYSQANEDLMRARLMYTDVARGKDMQVFVQSVIRDAKACNRDRFGQLIAAFEAMDGKIQIALTKPKPDTTLEEFLENCKEQESVIRKNALESMSVPAYQNRQSDPFRPNPYPNRQFGQTPARLPYPQRPLQNQLPRFQQPQHQQQNYGNNRYQNQNTQFQSQNPQYQNQQPRFQQPQHQQQNYGTTDTRIRTHSFRVRTHSIRIRNSHGIRTIPHQPHSMLPLISTPRSPLPQFLGRHLTAIQA